jgi:hypothetical protein
MGTKAELAAFSVFAIALSFACNARAQSIGQTAQPDAAAGAESSVAIKLQNPVPDLISVPLQNDFELGAGPGNPFGYMLNVQPVIPFPLRPGVNMISRTIIPVIDQPPLAAGVGRKVGLGDITQSFFFSPSKESAVIWGVGPVIVLPTATDERLGTGKWSAGPTAVFLVQAHGWTAGALVNHVWSFTGDDSRRNISATFLQPFTAYTWPIAFSITAQTETTYDWKAKQWTVPLALGISQVVKLGPLPVSIGLFGRYWVEGSDASPTWAVRVPITFVLPSFASRPAEPPPRPAPDAKSTAPDAKTTVPSGASTR